MIIALRRPQRRTFKDSQKVRRTLGSEPCSECDIIDIVSCSVVLSRFRVLVLSGSVEISLVVIIGMCRMQKRTHCDIVNPFLGLSMDLKILLARMIK